MTFVITAAYTVTFANAIYLMTVNNPDATFALTNMSFALERVLCGIVALIMTLRFFFGNNQYLADIMGDPQRGPWVKFYHFFFIALQSVVLIICSYSIRDSKVFVYGIGGLFALEIAWYFLTMVVDKEGVLPADLVARRQFFIAQMTNLGFIIGIAVASCLMGAGSLTWLIVVFVLFLANTAYDVTKNIGAYMGCSQHKTV